ncbi:hypothetical protein [Kitasatospora sp. NPDC087315]|uniref:hypothetical protein n=1 Tax=Kitasatospora sp. NPDC087315 TaxID=3364069 RepID=UPI0038000FB3
MTATTWRDQELHRLIDTTTWQLAAAWDALTRAQHAVLAAVRAAAGTRRRTAAIRAALRAFTAAVAAFDTAVVGIVERWASTELPIAYRHGAEAALHTAPWPVHLPRPGFHWTPEHQQAIHTLTAAAYERLLHRVNDTVRRARAFHRAVAETARRRESTSTEVLAREHRLGVVVYADSTRYPAAAWARSALAAQAVTAANTAAVRAAVGDLEAEWVQVVDGPGCGWTSHPDSDQAGGTLRTAAAAAAYPIAHPGCIRSFIPRPDLTGRTDIEDGQQADEEDTAAWR